MNFRLHNRRVLTLLFFIPSILAFSQTPTVSAVPVPGYEDEALKADITQFEVYQINSDALVSIVRDENFDHKVNLDIPGYGLFEMELFPNPILSPRYTLTVQTENGITHQRRNDVLKAFIGNLKGGQYLVSLTIDHNFIFGGIQLSGKDELRIEPLYLHVKGAKPDMFVVYRGSDAIEPADRTCHVREHVQNQIQEQPDQQGDSQRLTGQCKTVEIAFADDWLMFQAHGGVSGCENHNIGVMNDVQTNYDDEFADELSYEIVEIWVSSCSTCDPWTSSTNSDVLLNDFTDWGPSGFSETHDVAGLWSDRDFDGTTIGVAWLDAICTPFRYLIAQDFTNNGPLLRCLLAHELGHIFSAQHDDPGSGFIMAPAVSNTNLWSNPSISKINNAESGAGCLSICTTVQAPVADFSADATEGCEPFTVNFTDESTGPPTSWDWTFPGGSPSSSTDQNPTVTYFTQGTYDVILEVSNSAGTSTLVKSDYINVLTGPVADFAYSQSELQLFFTSLAQNADTWSWDFGDGGTSTEENPSHTYEQDGDYTITLTVTNQCGSDSYSLFLEVYVPPTAGFSADPDYGCPPLSVQFINESSDNVQSLEWFFPGGSPASSTQENPVVEYSEPGFYTVTLIVENVAGVDELTVDNFIEVAPLAESDFNFSVNGLSVQFVNNSNNADTYLWLFGDGSTSSATSPDHVYETGGTYQVLLIASNDCGPDTSSATIVLDAAPIADFTLSQSEGCVPLTVTFTSTSQGDVTSYQWSFPGGTPSSSTQEMPVVVYNTPGTYSVQLIVGNSIGSDTLMVPDAVVIDPNVVSGFDASIDGNIVDFTNTSTGATSYNWLVDGNTYDTEDLTYIFNEDGDYPVQLIATGACGSDTSLQIIHIATPPVAGIGSSETSGCQPFTVQFFNTSSSNATTFEWIFEGGTPGTSNEENPLVEYQEPGTYSVQLTVWSEGGMDQLVIDDMIDVAPLPDALFSTVQDGLQLSFSNASLNANSFHWDFGDGAMSDEAEPVHNYGDYGTYDVTLIATNDCGSDTLTLSIAMSTAPVPAFSAGQTQGCVPLEVQFTDMSQNNPELWEWSFPGGNPDTSNLQNPIIVYEQPGIYSVTLRVSNAGGAQALVRDEYIFVDYPPVSEFSADVNNAEVTFTNESQGGLGYLWSFGDGLVDTTENPLHTYTSSGTYSVQLITYNACAADTVVHQVTVTITAVGDPLVEKPVQVYPNPNTGQFFVKLNSPGDVYQLEVYDLLGRKVLQQELSGDTSPDEIMLQDRTSGIYTIVVRKADFRYVVKMVVVGE